MVRNAAEFKHALEAHLQPAAEPLVEPVAEPSSSEDDWLDLPEDRTKFPYDGSRVLLTRDLETAEPAQWLNTRRFDTKAMRWVPDGFWVAAYSRRRLYSSGVEPVAYRRAP
jgi:hypothetical protein